MITNLYCLTVTKDRPEFMPWLLWNFNNLHWPFGQKHLHVFVNDEGNYDTYNSYLSEAKLSGRFKGNVTFHHGFRVSSLGEHRQHALEVGCSFVRDHGEEAYFTWMDDDDWRHPMSAHLLMEACQREMEDAYDILPTPLMITSSSYGVPIIDIEGTLYVMNRKKIQWYESLIHIDLAEELPPFLPVNISEDFYWHLAAEALANSHGRKREYPKPTRIDFTSGNLVHPLNVAGKRLADHPEARPLEDGGGFLGSEGLKLLEELRIRLNERTQATS